MTLKEIVYLLHSIQNVQEKWRAESVKRMLENKGDVNFFMAKAEAAEEIYEFILNEEWKEVKF